MFGDVIVPLDGSTSATRALGPAGALAHYLDSAVRVVAIDRVGEAGSTSARAEAQLFELGDVDREFVTVSSDEDVATELLAISAAHPGALLCMATHGVDPGDEAGGVAAALLARSVLPMVLIGPEFSPSRFRCHGPLVTAVSSDPHSHAIVPVVEAFGIVFDFDVEFVTVDDDDAPIDALAAGATEAIGRAVHSHRLAGGDVAAAVVQRAADTRAALIAMATHGAGDDRASLLGSTTLAVVRHAPCPVLAMRPTAIAAG